jgi:hypothetical protein
MRLRPHPLSCFFKQPVLKGQISNALLQGTRFTAQVLHFTTGRCTGSITRQTPLTSFHELLGPYVIQALRDAFLAAQLRYAVITAQALKHDPDLVFGRKMPTGCTPTNGPSNLVASCAAAGAVTAATAIAEKTMRFMDQIILVLKTTSFRGPRYGECPEFWMNEMQTQHPAGLPSSLGNS